MALKRFEEYAKEFTKDNKEENTFNNLKNVNRLNVKSIETPVITEKKSKLNENSFLVGSDYKVKVVIDVPQSLVQEYIDKVKSETDKDPLENFSEAEIAEQIVSFLVKQNLVIDNLTPEFTVGSENVGNMQKSKDSVDSDAEKLSDDLGVNDEADGEIEFKDMNGDTDNSTDSKEENSDGEIEFSDNTEEKDLGEDREVDKSKKSNDSDSNFEEIEFEDTEKESTKPKTIGDYKKSQGQKIETKHKEEKATEEEEQIEDMYKKIGYKVGYYENLDLNNLRNQ